MAARLGGSEAGAQCQAIHSAGAAEAEDGDPADVAAQPKPRRGAGVEAGSCDARRRDRHDAVDLVRGEAGFGNRRRRGFHQQILRAFEIDRIAVVPAVGLFIPFDRGDEVTFGDAGIVEHARQPVEQGGTPAERPSTNFLGRRLLDHMRRNRGGEREYAAGLHSVSYDQPTPCR